MAEIKNYVLKHLDVNFKDYRVISFIGTKGSGKSTAAQLVEEIIREEYPEKFIVITVPLAYSVKITVEDVFGIFMIKSEQDFEHLKNTLFYYNEILQNGIDCTSKKLEILKSNVKILDDFDYIMDAISRHGEIFSEIINEFTDAHIHFIFEDEEEYLKNSKNRLIKIYELIHENLIKLNNIQEIIKNEDIEYEEFEEKYLGEYNKAAREIIRTVATELLREEFRPDIHVIGWLGQLKRLLSFMDRKETKDKTLVILVDDMRFMDEYVEFIRLFGDKFTPIGVVSVDSTDVQDTHQSETEPKYIIENFKLSYLIKNDKSKGKNYLKTILKNKFHLIIRSG